MKKSSLVPSARVTLGTLLLISCAVLVFLALNPGILHGRVDSKKSEPVSEKSGEVGSVASPETILPPSGILFSHNTIVDFSATSGEPFINSAPVAIPAPSPNVNGAPPTPAGAPFISVPFGFSTTVSLLWKSMDGGRSFIPLGTPIVRDAVLGPGGGDTAQDFDALGRFYYSDLGAACVTTAVSADGGNTFGVSNALACVGPSDPGGVTDDRQWSGGFGDGLGYMTVRNLAVSVGGNFHLNRTRDAGTTWPHAQQIGTVTQSGPLVTDKTKRNIGGTNYIVLYQLYHTGGGLKILRIKDPDTGANPSVDDLDVPTPGGGAVANVFPVMALDRQGNLYVTWSTTTAINMVTSSDRGENWSAVKRVSPTTGEAGTGTIIMPWVVAGDAGRIDVVWYRGSIAGNSTSSNNRWDIYMGQSLNALDTNPSWTYEKINEHSIHFGTICLGGLGCDLAVPPGSQDRSFLEFPSVTLDDRGAAQITWNDNTNQSAVTAAAAEVTGAPYVMFSKQICGQSLFTSVGNLGQSGPVTITAPAASATVPNPVTVQGTHTLPPATFDKDEAGDARFPDHGAVIGANIPAMDIRQVDMSETATNLIVKMHVADATLAGMATATGTSGGDGLLYLTQWDYDESTAAPIDKVFWVAAEVRAGQAVGKTGTLSVIRSSTSKKYITYTPDAVNSLSVATSISNTAPGTITLTIPKSLVGNPPNGALLKTTTGYAMSERGPLAAVPCPPAPASCENVFNPSSLPVQVDAAGAFTYVVGTGMQLDGVVELSLDDPGFSFPTPAVVSLNGTWQSTYPSLSSGTHTVYARQIVRGGCATSAVQSVAFTIPGPPVPTAVVSRKVHTGQGSFDIDLLAPAPGIECRSGGANGDHQIVVNFPSPVTVSGASVTSGTGSVSNFNATGNVVTVNLTGVTNAQRIAVTLSNVSSGAGAGDVAIPMGVLLGDTTANGGVNSSDIGQAKSNSGQTANSGNFRTDVTVNGAINSSDIGTIKSQSGINLP